MLYNEFVNKMDSNNFLYEEVVVEEGNANNGMGRGFRAAVHQQQQQHLQRLGLAPPQPSCEDSSQDQDDLLGESSTRPLDKEAFILAVQQFPCVWNQQLKEYKDRPMKTNAWKIISETFNDTGKFSYENSIISFFISYIKVEKK